MLIKETDDYVPQSLLNELFYYNKSSGELFWKVTTSSKTIKGDKVGYITDNGYLEVMLFGVKYKLHRLIYKLAYGTIPNLLDHIDGVRINNRLENLRPATIQENCFNSSIRSDNTSGYKGVSLDKRSNRWRAYINIEGKQKSLGYFDTAIEASNVREEVAKQLHQEFYRENNGNS